MNEAPTRSSAINLAAWCAIVAAVVVMGAVIWMLVASPPDEGGGPSAVVEPPRRGEPSAGPTSRGRTDLASAADIAPPPRITPSPFVDPDARPPSPRDGAEIDVEVLDPDGAPAADTMVLVGAADRHDCLGKKTSLAANLSRIRSPESRPDGIETATTDAAGKARFEGVAPTQWLTVAAWHPRHGLAASFGTTLRAGERQAITLRFDGTIMLNGFVMESSGERVAGASVEVIGPDDTGKFGRLDVAHTDADGRFETSRLRGTGFTLNFTSPEHFSAREDVRFLRPQQREQRVDVWLERAPLVRGRLLVKDGSPAKVADHLLALRDPRDPDARIAIIAAFNDPCFFGSGNRSEGRVVERDDVYEIRLQTKGMRYVAITFKGRVLGCGLLAGDHATEGPDIVVDWAKAPKPEPRGNLTVVARSHDGKPMLSYSLRLERVISIRSMQSESEVAVESVDGRHFVEGLKQGIWRITVTAVGFEPAFTETEVKADPVENEVVLSAAPFAATVVGKVVEGSGKPVGGARVFVFPKRLDAPVAAWTGGPTVVHSDAEGGFRFDGLALGTYTLIADAEGFAPSSVKVTAQQSGSPVIVPMVEGAAVEVVPEGATGPFSLVVMDSSSGLPVVRGDEGAGKPFDERVTVRLQPGRYEAVVTGPGIADARRRFEVVRTMTLRVPLTPSTREK